jgi:hypothetical protein
MTTQEGRDEPAQTTDEVAGGEQGARALSPEQVEEGLNATPNESTPGEATQLGEDGSVLEEGGSVRQSQGEEQ